MDDYVVLLCIDEDFVNDGADAAHPLSFSLSLSLSLSVSTPASVITSDILVFEKDLVLVFI